MRNALKFILALIVALALMLAVRAFVFTVYTVPADLSKDFRKGDRVMVNRLLRTHFDRGDVVIFGDSISLLGRIKAVPGDTLSIGRDRYLIPYRCCDRCPCPDCHFYLVKTDTAELLVHHFQIRGKAFRLFHLPW